MGRRRTVGARELKTRLGTYLSQVRRGATFVVTERGEPIAELRPLPVADDDVERRLQELAALGILARDTAASLPDFRAIPGRGAPLSDAVRQDREDRI